jgi:hypothetical protein
MAVAILKSTIIANRDSVPKILTDPYVSGGELRVSEGYVQTATATDSAGSIYRLCQIPSNARVEAVVLQCDALTGGAANVGVYYPTFIPTGAPQLAGIVSNQAINTSFFASAQSVGTALGPVNVVNQSGQNTIAKQELPLWQAIGLAADPGISLDICVTLSTAITAQGYIGLKTTYVE